MAGAALAGLAAGWAGLLGKLAGWLALASWLTAPAGLLACWLAPWELSLWLTPPDLHRTSHTQECSGFGETNVHSCALSFQILLRSAEAEAERK